ncbi:hypothetical protein [Parachitinimonas caeni]|uniref:Uncharacterized protein n=1 Tax=Parachitinimonas caeni TaxID=3031301 RepID=A0ABT7E3T7_9NEIS|nr:hypothetical protein [Parachitinimonas caeni]MDK2126981.1 hypothetical protein [Parachitinimonas caeni]
MMSESESLPATVLRRWGEQLADVGSRLSAGQMLINMGETALPILAGILDGTACNRFGVPYRRFGPVIESVLHIAGALGAVALPLAPAIREEVKAGRAAAIRALTAQGVLELETVEVLREVIRTPRGGQDFDWVIEASHALARYGFAKELDRKHPG